MRKHEVLQFPSTIFHILKSLHDSLLSAIIIVRTSFGLDSKTGFDSGPTNLNNEFVEHGRKNWPEFREEVTIMDGLEE